MPRDNWWAGVWRGLVVDPDGKHYDALGLAVWLFLYLILHADRETGVLRRKQETIAHHTGRPQRTIRRWMRRLRDGGYVAIRPTGRALEIRILRWRRWTRERPDVAGQTGQLWPVRAARNGHSARGSNGRKTKQPSEKTDEGRSPYKNSLTKSLLQKHLSEEDSPAARQELLARDLAEGLDDPEGHRRYLEYARRFPEPLLRRLLSEVKAVPRAKIRRSRAALFRYRLNQHVAGANHSRN